jgi:uncharacterized protein YecT (DUF1311 family)
MKASVGFMVCALAASAALAAVPSSPVGKRYTRAFTDCMSSGEARDGVPSAVVGCRAEEIDRQDAELNRSYQALMRRLSKPVQANLRSQQREWIVARDQSCRDEMGEDEEGTLGQVTYTDCILDETIKRVLWLERYR